MTTTRHWLIATTFIVAVSNSAMAQDGVSLSSESVSLRGDPSALQWMPWSVTVLEADEVDETARFELEDLEGLVPGMVVDSLGVTPRGAAISVRGIGSGAMSAGFFPAVAVMVDGIYQGTHASQNPLLFDFERVEVVRSPDGMFTAAPAAGGAIRLLRKQPTDEFDAAAELVAADKARVRLNGMLNVPLTEQLAARFRLSQVSGGKIVDNASPDASAFGRSENDDDLLAASAAFKFDVSDTLALRYRFDITRDDSVVPARLNLSAETDLTCSTSDDDSACSVNGNGLRPETGTFDATTQNFSNARSYETDQHAFYVDFAYGEHQLVSTTAWRESDEVSSMDLDGSFVDVYSTSRQQQYEQLSQELVARGPVREDVSYVAGFYFLKNEYQLDATEFFVLPILDEAGRIVDVPEGAARTTSAYQDASLVSFSGHVTWDAGVQWVFDAGVRLSHINRDFRATVSRVASADPDPAPSRIVGDVSSPTATGTVGAAYRVDDEAMVYLRYSRDYQPVGFNDAAVSANSAGFYDAASVESVEVGLKSEWWDDRLRLNYVGFQNNWRDKVERFPSRTIDGRIESTLDNVARVEVRGHELEIEALPTDRLRLRAALSHQNADYLEYRIPDLTGTDPFSDRSDLIPTLGPADMFHVSGLYTWPFQGGMLKLYAGYRFTTEYWTDSTVATGRINNFSLLDLSVDYEWRDWTFRFFSRNLNSKRYLTNVDSPLDSEVASLAPSFTSTIGIATTAEVNEPEVTGLQVVYRPSF